MIRRAVETLRKRLPPPPALAVILGSGAKLEGEPVASLHYSEIPGMPAPGVSGHAGYLTILRIERRWVAALAGRRHFYEGASWEEVTFATRLLAAWGVRALLVTNAAGGITPDLEVGDLMLIRRTLDLLTPRSLTAGSVRTLARGPRLLRSPLIRQLHSMELKSGTYAAVLGPNYETRAEIQMLAAAGADAVGMSTVPELLVAEETGLPAAGVSIITNSHASPSHFHGHETVLAQAEKASGKLQRVVEKLLGMVVA